jgi:hypothetical protein
MHKKEELSADTRPRQGAGGTATSISLAELKALWESIPRHAPPITDHDWKWIRQEAERKARK